MFLDAQASPAPTPIHPSVLRKFFLDTFGFSFCQRLWALTKSRDDRHGGGNVGWHGGRQGGQHGGGNGGRFTIFTILSCNYWKWHHLVLVAKFANYANGATWWPKLQLMQVAPPGRNFSPFLTNFTISVSKCSNLVTGVNWDQTFLTWRSFPLGLHIF